MPRARWDESPEVVVLEEGKLLCGSAIIFSLPWDYEGFSVPAFPWSFRRIRPCYFTFDSAPPGDRCTSRCVRGCNETLQSGLVFRNPFDYVFNYVWFMYGEVARDRSKPAANPSLQTRSWVAQKRCSVSSWRLCEPPRLLSWVSVKAVAFAAGWRHCSWSSYYWKMSEHLQMEVVQGPPDLSLCREQNGRKYNILLKKKFKKQKITWQGTSWMREVNPSLLEVSEDRFSSSLCRLIFVSASENLLFQWLIHSPL